MTPETSIENPVPTSEPIAAQAPQVGLQENLGGDLQQLANHRALPVCIGRSFKGLLAGSWRFLLAMEDWRRQPRLKGFVVIHSASLLLYCFLACMNSRYHGEPPAYMFVFEAATYVLIYMGMYFAACLSSDTERPKKVAAYVRSTPMKTRWIFIGCVTLFWFLLLPFGREKSTNRWFRQALTVWSIQLVPSFAIGAFGYESVASYRRRKGGAQAWNTPRVPIEEIRNIIQTRELSPEEKERELLARIPDGTVEESHHTIDPD